MNHRSPLSRRQWLLIAFGLGAWVAIAAGAVWLVHQLTRPAASCGAQIESRTTAGQDASQGGPRNALQLLAGTGRCPS